MPHRSLGALAVAIVVAVPGASNAAPAWVEPPADARYAGVAGDNTSWADLRVSHDGRSLEPRRSSIELVWASCGRPMRRQVFRLGRRRRPVRVSRSGRFRFVRRSGESSSMSRVDSCRRAS